MTARKKGWRLLLNEQIRRSSNIETILREPEQRIKSGINTYVQQIKNANPNLDNDTILWFATNYPFLNRHYSPQVSWLINLSRYIKPSTLIKFYSMEDLKDIAIFDMKPPGIENNTVNIENFHNFEMYVRLDNALLKTCLGKSLTFESIIKYIRSEDPIAYDHCIGYSEKILKPVYVLSQT